MRVPQISERVKEAPAQALRGVFAGIGQLLLVTDKLRNKTPAGAGVPRTRTPEASGPASASAAATAAAAEPATAPGPTAESSPVADPPPAAAVTPDVVAAEAVVADAAVAEEPVAVAAVVAEPTARKSAAKPAARDFDKTGNVRLLAGQEDAEAAASDVPAGPAASDVPAAPAASDVPAAPAASDVPAAPAETTPLPLPNYDELSIASLRARLRNLDIPQLKRVADYERSHAGRAEVIAMFERRVAKLEAEPQAGA
jgi:hypothetical protein